MKKIYYTVYKQLDCTGESLNGVKDIYVYHIENGKIVKIGSFDCLNEENTVFRVESFLNENGYSDIEVNLVCL